MRVTVYAGSAAGNKPAFRHLAAGFGRDLAHCGVDIVYGGGRVGLMGAVADGALDAGGTVIGVIPQSLARAEIAHQGLSRLHVVRDLHSRKHLMSELGDCFVALPGSMGTFEEIFESWAHLVLGLHAKPVMLLNHEDYWDSLNVMLDHMATSGFARVDERRSLPTVRDAAELLDVVGRWRAPSPRWVTAVVRHPTSRDLVTEGEPS
jgi:uncharacterized protein (TIGR00730 family)